MSSPRFLVSGYFWLCAAGLMGMSIIIDIGLGYWGPPITYGTPGDIVFVVGFFVLAVLWPRGRVWPGMGIHTKIQPADQTEAQRNDES